MVPRELNIALTRKVLEAEALPYGSREREAVCSELSRLEEEAADLADDGSAEQLAARQGAVWAAEDALELDRARMLRERYDMGASQ